MPEPKFRLPPEEALEFMRAAYENMKRDPNRNQLPGMSPDDAFEAGYRCALGDFESLTGPDPREENKK